MKSVWISTCLVLPYCLFFIPIVFGQNSLSREADQAFAQGKYATARQLYSNARDKIRDEKDRAEWKRMSMQIVRCQTALGDREQAAEEFFLLCRIDPLTPLDYIPLPWFVPLNPKQGTRPREKTAEDWLDPLQNKTKSPAAMLLAAGILSISNNSSKQNQGMQQLRNLAGFLDSETDSSDKNKKDTAIQIQQDAAMLAGVLLWKEQRIPMLRNASELIPLRRFLDKIPESQQAGPLYLYGRAAKQVGETEEAVLAWMRIPILYGENRPLAAEALREASATLKKLGRMEQAESLQKEAEFMFDGK